MSEERAPWWRALAWAAARGVGFLVAVGLLYVPLRVTGLWYPLQVENYGYTALIIAASLAFWYRWPIVHLIVIALLVANPLWLFNQGEVRAIPLVLAAYLTSRAGLRLAIALPVVVLAAILGQYPAWLEYIFLWAGLPDLALDARHFDLGNLLWAYVILTGFSQQALVVGLAVAAVLLGRAFARQARATEALRAQNEELVRLRESDSKRIVTEAREEIARDVHDVVAHHLAALVVRAQAAARVAERDPDAPRAAVGWIAEAGRQALTEMRGLVRVLRNDGDGAPRMTASVTGAIEAAAERVRAAGIEVRTELSVPDGLSTLAEFALVRVCQEALTNVLVHSRATRVYVRLAAARGAVSLLIEDDGAGRALRTSSTLARAGGGGSGIPGMHERAAAAGGVLSAGPSPRGWRVELVVPVAAATTGAAA